MTTTLSQSDAERFTIFIDTAIDSPRFTLSDFCKAAKLTADQATAWLTRPDIAATLESCIGFVAAAARLRQIVLDTNAMGALGELLHTSKDQIEVRRAATTIISRHKADLRPSRASRPRTTDPSAGQCDTHREAVEVHSRGSPRSGIPGTNAQIPPHPNGVQVLPTSESTSPTRSENPRGSALASPSTSHAATSSSSSFITQNSTLTSTKALLRALDIEARLLRKQPAPPEPHSAKSILNRVGSTTAMSRDRPR